MTKLSLVFRPLPPPKERPGTHCLRMCEIFSVKSVLVDMQKIILTKYRAFFELVSSNDLTYRTPLGYYLSGMAVSFF